MKTANAFLFLLVSWSITVGAVESSKTPPRSAGTRYEIPVLNIATFEGTDWTPEKIRNQLDAVAAVFAQCNVRLGDVKIHQLPASVLPDEMSGRSPYAPNGAVAVRTATPEIPQPAIYLVGRMADSSGFTKAVMRVNAPPCEPELANTIWLPDVVNTPEYQEGRHTRPFATLAHELTHLLTREGQHNGEMPYNQLAIWSQRTDLMSAEICREITESVFVREIKNTK